MKKIKPSFPDIRLEYDDRKREEFETEIQGREAESKKKELEEQERQGRDFQKSGDDKGAEMPICNVHFKNQVTFTLFQTINKQEDKFKYLEPL